MDLPDRVTLFNVGRAYYRARASRVDASKVDLLGANQNLVVGGQSVMAAKVVQQIGYQSARHFLSGSFGDDLDRYVYDRTAGKVTRKGAAPAVAIVRFFRAGGIAGSLPTGTLLTTVGGSSNFVLTTPAVFALGGTTATAFVRATQGGKTAQVGANNIRGFAQPSRLFDQTIQCTNDVASAGGEDREDDDTLKQRFLGYWASLSKGTQAAIEFGAMTVSGVVSAQAVEALTPEPTPARVVNLYIADSTGVSNRALAAQVISALDEYRACGISVLLSTSIPLIVQIQMALTFAGNVDTVTIGATVRAAIVSFVNTLPVNAPLLLGDLYSVIRRFKSQGVIATQGAIVVPTGDIYPPIGFTFRTSLSNVT